MKRKITAFGLAIVLCWSFGIPVWASSKAGGAYLTADEIMNRLPTDPQQVVAPKDVSQIEFLTFIEKENWTEKISRESIFFEIADKAKELTRDKANDAAKAKAIYDWITGYLTYDDTAYEYYKKQDKGETLTVAEERRYMQAADPLYAFCTGKAICCGYSMLSTLMLSLVELPSAYISGVSNNGGPHEWNVVYVDGRWTVFDATWGKWDMPSDFHQSISDVTFLSGIFRGKIFSWEKSVECSLIDGVEVASQIELPNWENIKLAYRFAAGNEQLRTVRISPNVVAIGQEAFADCVNLTNLTIPSSVVEIGAQAFRGCTSLKDVEIPGKVNILCDVFSGCTGLKRATIHEGVSTVRGAFAGCTSLTDIIIPESVTELVGTFSGCSALTHITLPKNLTQIGYGTFEGCSGLTEVVIPQGVTQIGGSAFGSCTNLKQIEIPQGVKKIEWGAFSLCDTLASVTLPDSITEIEDQAFSWCKNLSEIQMPKQMVSIGRNAFQGCQKLCEFTIPDGITRIEEGTFSFCDCLTNVVIPKSVISIGMEAFEGCTELKSVFIPESVTSIDLWALKFCDNVTIYSTAGSYAEVYAKEQNISFFVGQMPKKDGSVAYASDQTILVNDRPINFQMYALKDTSGNPTNYVKLRDVASVLNGTPAQFDVSWDGTVNILNGQAYTPNGSEMTTPFSGDRSYTSATAPTKVNGKEIDIDAIVLEDDQGGAYTYYKLRDLGRALGFKVDWSTEKGIFVKTE